ncbi:MAG: hypothetical protein Q9208_002245 [Pyrenodesmia sp. 3 TL-2023]
MSTLRRSHSAPTELGVPTYRQLLPPADSDDSDDLCSLLRHGNTFISDAGANDNGNMANPDDHLNACGCEGPTHESEPTEELSLYYEDLVTGRIMKRVGMFHPMDPRHPANVAKAALETEVAEAKEVAEANAKASEELANEGKAEDGGEEKGKETGEGVAMDAKRLGR